MKFEESYFKGEYRNGFYVSGMMKRYWAAQMEVLEEIKKVCSRHNIKWFAEWGTLLGAVRHKGFIPWDDDMDIGMLRRDYQRFLAVVRKELPDGYEVWDFHTKEGHTNYFMFVVNSARASCSQERLDKYHGCPFVVGMDIFPIDYIPRKNQDAMFQKSMISAFHTIICGIKKKTITNEELQMFLGYIDGIGEKQLETSDKNLMKHLLGLMEGLSAMYQEDESDKVTPAMPEYSMGKYQGCSKHCYDDVIWLPFETTTIAVPIGYEEVLKEEYGDYRKMVRNYSSHQYPCYRTQEKELRDYSEKTNLKMPEFLKKELELTKRYMDLPIPIEIDNFKKIRENDYYYIDKTRFATEFLKDYKKIWWITIPERFGVSTLLSVLGSHNKDDGETESKEIWNQLYIENEKIQWNYSIVFSFKGYNEKNFEETTDRFKRNISYYYKECSKAVDEGKVSEEWMRLFIEISEQKVVESAYTDVFKILANCLAQSCDQKVIVILENIDSILSNAYRHGFYDQMSDFLGNLIQNVIQDNETVEKMILTSKYEIESDKLLQGVFKEDVKHLSLFDVELEDYFGYTEEEVQKMLYYYQMEDQLQEARRWFSGYGSMHDLYNPWSINNYVASVCNGAKEPYTYWIEASEDEVRKELIKKFSDEIREDIMRLLKGEMLEKKVHNEVNFECLYKDVNEVWNYLFLSGCLVIKELHECEGDETAFLMIPNEECLVFFENIVKYR